MKPYYLQLPNGTQLGPIAESVIRRDMRSDRYPAGTVVWTEGLEEWLPLESVLTASERPVIPDPVDEGEAAEEAVGTLWGTLRYALTHWQYEGRITRRVFWRCALMLVACATLLDYALAHIAAKAVFGMDDPSLGAFLFMLGNNFLPLALMLILLPLFSRRLHDPGYSAKYLLLYFLGPLGVLILLGLACKDSQYGNEYGPYVKYPD